MVEFVRTKYTRLFEVRILHHYWLDEGATLFDAIADQNLKNRRLLTYDVGRVLTTEPSPATTAMIDGLRGVFRATGLGLLVAVPDDTVVPLDATFEFYVTVVAPDYPTYTALTLRSQEIVDVADPDPDSDEIYRYKANVPVLSNLTGTSRGTGDDKRLYLSTEYVIGADAGDAVEALVSSSGNLRQLTGDPPDAPFHELGPKASQPVYVHQNDVPQITPPAGSVGAPPRGIELTADIPPTVAAVIRLSPRRDDDAAFSFTTTTGKPRTPPRVFEVHLRNRWTTWRYLDKATGDEDSTEADPLPLTYFGNAGTRQKPSTAAIHVERNEEDPPKVTRLVSDVYV